MADINKPSGSPVSQLATFKALEQSGSGTIDAGFMQLSIYGKGSTGTFSVTVGSEPTQSIPAGDVFNLPYIGKPYSQAVVCTGGGTVTLEIAVIY